MHGQTCLFYAAKHGRTYLVEYLLDHGADPNHIDKKGMTPVQMAHK